jgi:hypothetical protein
LASHQAVVTRPADFVNIQEGHDVPHRQGLPESVRSNAWSFQDPSDTDVPGNDRVRDTLESAAVKMHVRSANLTRDGLEKHSTGLDHRIG